MTAWYRDNDFIVLDLDQQESAIMHSLIGQIRELLAERAAATPQDELAELTGITMGPSTPPTDPILARLLPDFHRLDVPATNRTDRESASLLRTLHEPELLNEKINAADLLLSTCPPDGGEVRLTIEQAETWLLAINDVRLALGTMLEVTQDMPETLPDDDPRSVHFGVYRWLAFVQDSLLMAIAE